jgi:hypothetical protein
MIDEDKYREFKYIISGCRTLFDAIYFGDLYTKRHPEMKELVNNIINGKRYEKILCFKNMKMLSEKILEEKYREDAEDLINYNAIDKTDLTQIKTLMRLARNKPSKPYEIKKINPKLIDKRCPHCSKINTYDMNKSYIICGYTDDHVGYDWHGCGKDWCFKCDKMLCKTWDKNSLFITANRYHNSECCKKHAKENNKNYIEEYCQCNNTNVNREVLKYDFDINKEELEKEELEKKSSENNIIRVSKIL